MTALNQKEQAEVRNGTMERIQEVFPDGVMTTEGLAVEVSEGVFVAIKVVVKKEGFDLDDAVEEYNDKLKKAEEREAEKVAKAEAREKKAKEAEQKKADAAKAKEGKTKTE